MDSIVSLIGFIVMRVCPWLFDFYRSTEVQCMSRAVASSTFFP